MNWKIEFTTAAREDLRNIFSYIAYELCEPIIAKRQTNRILNEIQGLDTMPMRYQLYQEEPWFSQGLRYFPVNNYLVFFLPNVESNQISIVRIIYGGRDLKQQLADFEG